jgi:hypothetical protein
MKKLFALCIAVAMISFMACGGGKDKEKEAKRIADSARIADSTTKAQADTLAAQQAREAAAAALKAKEDSIAKVKKGGKK